MTGLIFNSSNTDFSLPVLMDLLVVFIAANAEGTAIIMEPVLDRLRGTLVTNMTFGRRCDNSLHFQVTSRNKVGRSSKGKSVKIKDEQDQHGNLILIVQM